MPQEFIIDAIPADLTMAGTKNLPLESSPATWALASPVECFVQAQTQDFEPATDD
jgi:hypothetical protein